MNYYIKCSKWWCESVWRCFHQERGWFLKWDHSEGKYVPRRPLKRCGLRGEASVRTAEILTAKMDP